MRLLSLGIFCCETFTENAFQVVGFGAAERPQPAGKKGFRRVSNPLKLLPRRRLHTTCYMKSVPYLSAEGLKTPTPLDI